MLYQKKYRFPKANRIYYRMRYRMMVVRPVKGVIFSRWKSCLER